MQGQAKAETLDYGTHSGCTYRKIIPSQWENIFYMLSAVQWPTDRKKRDSETSEWGLIKKFFEPQRSDYTKSHMQDKQAPNQQLIFPESANGTSYQPIF